MAQEAEGSSGVIYLDNSIYVYAKNKVKVILLVFVDNCTFMSNSLQLLDDFVELSRSFKLRDLGLTIALLGIEITRYCPNLCLILS